MLNSLRILSRQKRYYYLVWVRDQAPLYFECTTFRANSHQNIQGQSNDRLCKDIKKFTRYQRERVSARTRIIQSPASRNSLHVSRKNGSRSYARIYLGIEFLS